MQKYLWIASVSLFGVSLLLPTHCTNIECSDSGSGLELLLSGWMAAFFNHVAAAWFANPFYIVALRYSKKRPVLSIVLALIAILIARTFLDGGELLLNEAGHTAYITKIQIGYWFWFGSMVVLLFASIFTLIERRKLK